MISLYYFEAFFERRIAINAAKRYGKLFHFINNIEEGLEDSFHSWYDMIKVSAFTFPG